MSKRCLNFAILSIQVLLIKTMSSLLKFNNLFKLTSNNINNVGLNRIILSSGQVRTSATTNPSKSPSISLI